ncbi:cryptochrome/photolyase family protein [Xanthovirga aplysinae]|uniref:cryptochrome/photolyase family protein n=1 Tax=Xanthovirga aplysinae TaxID=2529853 RepID=UPI0031B5888F
MKKISRDLHQLNLIFPHQLFESSPLIKSGFPSLLIEEYLFFHHFHFHQQKMAFHRASMKFYAAYLETKNLEVEYVEAQSALSDTRILIPELKAQKITQIHYIDPVDFLLEKRLNRVAEKEGIKLTKYPSPAFLNSLEELTPYFPSEKKKFFHASFYKEQRKLRGVLIEDKEKPQGGKWSFDTENRKKYPANKEVPKVDFPKKDSFFKEAISYVKNHFPARLGNPPDKTLYPHTFSSAKKWLEGFLHQRLKDFGTYEDAIRRDGFLLHHSLISPLLNTGLLNPREVVEKVLNFSQKKTLPLNSTEGFIRQLIGWREFIRGIYVFRGTEERKRNFWGFHRKIPDSFYSATTGILPLDTVIEKVLQTGYCHHIERLMVIGNFMLLCEFDPDEVYR